MAKSWLFDEPRPAQENLRGIYDKLAERFGTTHGYKGNPESIRVYREQYIPKIEAMYHRIQMVVRDVQRKDKSNPKLWECVETPPFQEDSFHVGLFIPVHINMQDPPDRLLQEYRDKFGEECYRKLSDEVRAFIWPQLQRCCRPYIDEMKMVHENATLEICDDACDDVYDVVIRFTPKEIESDKKGGYRFMPGLENWMFSDLDPAMEKAGIFQKLAKKQLSRSMQKAGTYDSDYAKAINAETNRLMETKKPREIFHECMAIACKKQGALKGDAGKEFAEGTYRRFSKNAKAELCETGGMYWVYVEGTENGEDVQCAYQPLVSKQSKRWSLHKAAREIALNALSHKDFQKQQKAEEGWLFDGFNPTLTPAQEQALDFIFPTPAEEGVLSLIDRFFKKTENAAARTPEHEEINPNSLKGRAIYASKNGICRMENGKFNPMLQDYIRWIAESAEIWYFDTHEELQMALLSKSPLAVKENDWGNGTVTKRFKVHGIEFAATLATAEDHDMILELHFSGVTKLHGSPTTVTIQMSGIAWGWAYIVDGINVWPNERREAYRLGVKLINEQFKRLNLPFSTKVYEDDEDEAVTEGTVRLLSGELYEFGDYRDDNDLDKLNEMASKIDEAADMASRKLKQNSKFRECNIGSDWDKFEFIVYMDIDPR